MPTKKAEDQERSAGAQKALMVVGVIVLVIATGVGSYLFARRDSSASQNQADQRGVELAQVQSQLRSAAKQNDYLAEQVRQGTQALNNAGTDSQHAEKRLRAALRKAREAIAKAHIKQLKTQAKLQGLSSGLKGTLGAVNYIPPAKKGDAGSIQGSITIANSAGTALDAVCVVDVGAVKYAVESLGVPSKGSVVESFQFPYSGPKPSGASSGGCGRL
jgi:type II secretory pathway pseudopilin PulG